MASPQRAASIKQNTHNNPTSDSTSYINVNCTSGNLSLSQWHNAHHHPMHSNEHPWFPQKCGSNTGDDTTVSSESQILAPSRLNQTCQSQEINASNTKYIQNIKSSTAHSTLMITHTSQLTYMAKYWHTYNLQLISMLEGHQLAQSHFLLYKIMVPRGNKPGDIQSRDPTPRPWSSLDRNCEIMRGRVGEAKSEQHHHTLTTPNDSDILVVSSTSLDSFHEWTTLTRSVVINSYMEPETEKWQPHAKLHHRSSSYPLCETLPINATSRIKEICNLHSTIPILWSTHKCALHHITVEHLRDFVASKRFCSIRGRNKWCNHHLILWTSVYLWICDLYESWFSA